MLFAPEMFRLLSKQTIKVIVFTSLFSFLLSGCDYLNSHAQDGGSTQHPPAPKVEIIEITPKPVVIKKEISGRATPYLIAEVRPQIGGIIQERRFKEGGLIEAGEVLYQIESALYQASLDSAEAALEKAKANLTTARLKANRYKDLLSANAVSKQEYDDADAVYRQAKAAVAVEQAAVETARIKLEYTSVSSPISGRIGRSSVTPGALVTANQAQALAVVQKLDPIYVDLSQSSAEILRMRKALNLSATPDDLGIEVQLTLEDGETYSHLGELEFSEVSVDETTGSVTLRAVFPNPEGLLMPGMFVRAAVQAESIDEGLMIPPQSLSRNIKGEPVVMLLGEGDLVEPRVLGKVDLVDGQWLVREGLNPGDKVIVAGLQRIRPGMQVNIINPSITQK